MDYAQALKSLPKSHEFFIGIDSDGCVFDSMEVKMKECFCPAVIKHCGLQNVAKYARETWEFVNLYSKTRGTNRFPALVRVLELLRERPEVQRRGVQVPKLPELEAWIAEETKLGNPALQARIAATDSAELKRVMAWSLEVNARVADLVSGVPPFPGVRETLSAASHKADLLVVSSTPLEALQREWQEYRLDSLVMEIAGQEHGNKTQHLDYTTTGKYDRSHVLMIGDAPGDLKAARANGALFCPIVPGREEESWARLRDEGLERFFADTWEGAYQEELLREFDAALPEAPPWQ